MRILLYAECGSAVGTGHVMRCIALAHSLHSRGDDILIASEDGSANELAGREGLPFHAVSRGHIDSMLAADAFDVVVIDSYLMSSETLATLNRLVPVVYFDDLQQDVFGVSLLVNGNLTAKLERYDRIYRGRSTRVLAGASYCVLRQEFSNLPRFENKRQIENVLISTGGSDPHAASVHLSETLLACRPLSDATVHVLVGALNPNVDKLQDLEKASGRLVLHRGVSRVAGIMRMCDLAVAAAGTTLNELCTCGVPTIAYALADNQRGCPAVFARKSAACDAGEYLDDRFFRRFSALIERAASDYHFRVSLSQASQQLFDGKGADRICEAIHELIHTKREEG